MWVVQCDALLISSGQKCLPQIIRTSSTTADNSPGAAAIFVQPCPGCWLNRTAIRPTDVCFCLQYTSPSVYIAPAAHALAWQFFTAERLGSILFWVLMLPLGLTAKHLTASALVEVLDCPVALAARLSAGVCGLDYSSCEP